MNIDTWMHIWHCFMNDMPRNDNMTKTHHIMTKSHHVMVKPHHIMAKPHYVMVKPHHVMVKPHHIMVKPHHIIFLSVKKWYHLTRQQFLLILTPRLCTQDGKTIPHLKAKRTSFQQNITFTLKKSTYLFW